MDGSNQFRKVLCVSLDPRPEFTRAVLASLHRCEGIEDYRILANIDEGSDETLALTLGMNFTDIDISIKPKARNPSERVVRSIQRAFGKAQFAVYVDGDVILARDFLRYMEYCEKAFLNDPDVFRVACESPKPTAGASGGEIARRPLRWGAAAGIWRNRWEWSQRTGRPTAPDYLEWLSKLAAKHGLQEVYPVISRCRRITKPGEAINKPAAEEFCESKPKVTAVMITGLHRERYAMARVSIECFKAQTYPNKNLLIVNHGEESLAAADPRIRELRIQKSRWQTVGDLRNLALEHATGDFVINWDDDDWSHPRRIEAQMQKSAEDTAVLLRTRIHYDLVKGCARYVEYPRGAEATILHPRRVRYRYPSLLRGSDTVFAQQFSVRLAIEDDPALHIRFFHGRNLWSAAHIMGSSAHESELNEEHRALLARVLPLYGSCLPV